MLVGTGIVASTGSSNSETATAQSLKLGVGAHRTRPERQYHGSIGCIEGSVRLGVRCELFSVNGFRRLGVEIDEHKASYARQGKNV